MGPALSDPRLLRPARRADGRRGLLFLAYRDGRPIAGALNLIGADALYGRYWGAIEEVPFLHFELCYYRAIEWAIEHGPGSVQAGAQGEHKLARGYEPVVTRSLHFLPDPGFRAPSRDFLAREREAIAAELEWLPAGAALPLVLAVDRDARSFGSGHAAIHARGGEAPGRLAVGRDGDQAALAAQSPDLGQHRVERLPAALAADARIRAQLVRGDGADEIFARAGGGPPRPRSSA